MENLESFCMLTCYIKTTLNNLLNFCPFVQIPCAWLTLSVSCYFLKYSGSILSRYWSIFRNVNEWLLDPLPVQFGCKPYRGSYNIGRSDQSILFQAMFCWIIYTRCINDSTLVQGLMPVSVVHLIPGLQWDTVKKFTSVFLIYFIQWSSGNVPKQ